jgi:inhibitor of KinA
MRTIMSTHAYPKLVALGDSALTIELGASISPRVNRRVHALAHALSVHPIFGVLDVVPAFASLTLFYDPVRVQAAYPDMPPGRALELELGKRYREAAKAPAIGSREVDLPVYYGGDFGPDLQELAHLHGMTEQAFIDLHAKRSYSVYMLGFAPGFAYLSGLDRQLHTARRASPRAQVAAGSVAIGGAQTGVYPLATPGGWNIIGRTPLPLFRPDDDAPSLLRPGDSLRFRPISLDEFRALTIGRKS